jgi:hypothetical protein
MNSSSVSNCCLRPPTNRSNRIRAPALDENSFPWFVIVSTKYSPHLVKVYGGIEVWGIADDGVRGAGGGTAILCERGVEHEWLAIDRLTDDQD